MTQPSLLYLPVSAYAAHRAEVATEQRRRTSLMWKVLTALEQAGPAGAAGME